MPRVSEFYGIVVWMFPDHAPPHFHAVYGGDEAAIGIDHLDILTGQLPRRARRLVFEWAAMHQQELAENWTRARRLEPLLLIKPLGSSVSETGDESMPLPLDRAESVRVVRPYVIEVTFRDGTERDIDIEPLLWGQVFEPLRDPALFAQAAVDPLGGSVYWPTGADLAPEFLYFGEEGPPPGYYAAGAGVDEEAEVTPETR